MLSLILLALAQAATPSTKTVELSTRWHPAGTIETGLRNVASVMIMPVAPDSGGNLFVVDSSGDIAELRYDQGRWGVLGTRSVGEPIISATVAAMRVDPDWSIIVGTRTGRLLELQHGLMGWSHHVIDSLKPPLRAVAATEPARPGPSQVFAIDADGKVMNYYVGASGRWISLPVPPTDGGATHICFDYHKDGLLAVTAGPKGIVHKFIQDSLGVWSGGAWDTLSAPCLDLAMSADPTQRDICIYYSGTDGQLRYLFSGRMNDVTSRLPVAGGTHHLIGKGDQRRFAEFFGMHGAEFNLYEFSSDANNWVEVPIGEVDGTVVSTTFGPARGGHWCSAYAATREGKIFEFVRDGLDNAE
jgi:hypothetical protein